MPGRKHPFEYGLIGVGGFGAQHLAVLRSLEQSGEIRLAAVCDPGIHRFPEVEADLKRCKVRIYQDYLEMLDREDNLAAVTIAAPIPLHDRMVKACLGTGVFVYLEKPPVPLLSQLDDLIAADKERKVAVGFQMIESDWSRQFKQWIAEGKLGEVLEIRAAACWPRADSYYQRAKWAGRMAIDGEPVFDGPATNALAHLIHNIMFLAAVGPGEFDAPVEVQGELYRARPIESYDTACMRGRFSSGTRFFAAVTHATEKPLPFQMEIVGTKGWARIAEDSQLVESSLGSLRCNGNVHEALLRSYLPFLDYMKGGGRPPSTLLRDARGYSLATNAMLESSGGIHTIDKKWIRRIGDDGNGQYSVPDLQETIAGSLGKPLLFSETELPWAVKTSAVPTKDFKLRDAGK